MPLPNYAGSLTDAQARRLVVAALRKARQAYRKADTAGEREERELDRLIKRKTRMNATQLATLSKRYAEWVKLVEAAQGPLTDAFYIASQFGA